MSEWTRRDLLRVTAASAAATVVPTVALDRDRAVALSAPPEQRADQTSTLDTETLDAFDLESIPAGEPIMVCVRDTQRGDVSILQGTDEVVLNDRRLVAKIIRARTSTREA